MQWIWCAPQVPWCTDVLVSLSASFLSRRFPSEAARSPFCFPVLSLTLLSSPVPGGQSRFASFAMSGSGFNDLCDCLMAQFANQVARTQQRHTAGKGGNTTTQECAAHDDCCCCGCC